MATFTVRPTGVQSMQAQVARFIESGAGTYQADFPIPQDASLIDIIVEAESLWDAGTSAALIIGDAADDDGWLASVNLKATDLLAGESISLLSTQTRGGNAGAYLTVGTSTHLNRRFAQAGQTISAKVVSVGAGSAGRTRITVMYVCGDPTDITL